MPPKPTGTVSEPKFDPVSLLVIERQSIEAEERAKQLWQEKYGNSDIMRVYDERAKAMAKYAEKRNNDIPVPKKHIPEAKNWLAHRDPNNVVAITNPLPQDRASFPQTTTQEVGWFGENLELFGVGQHGRKATTWE
ncbi:C20orf85 family protein [Carpediemonas membranifera]|uniref:C20orf85 family protein n=1 Tax=Carpediemonas membranifera TaxID=201153 RepID=A0A8J6ASW6_9EUKA|nr:C20orf85 family protein [Carpediemonas membranifera]|eukprot:KAG9393676.1 C20orf85 family protein [Carpediemonas membranifera]